MNRKLPRGGLGETNGRTGARGKREGGCLRKPITGGGSGSGLFSRLVIKKKDRSDGGKKAGLVTQKVLTLGKKKPLD